MNILHIEWKTRIKSLVVWAVVVIVILGVFMAFFPSMQSSGMQDLVNTKMNCTSARYDENFAYGFDGGFNEY